MPLPTSIQRYWKLDAASGTNVADELAVANGTWQGTTTAVWGTGKINNGGVFNGTNNYIDFGTGGALSGTSAFSISMWVKTTQAAVAELITQRDTVSFNGCYRMRMNATGFVEFNIFNGAFFSGADWNGVVSSVAINDGNWHHVVVVRVSSTVIKIYIDNVEVASVTGAASVMNAGIKTFVGKNVRDNTQLFTGTIDEIGIWTKGLSVQEVSDLYNSGSGRQYPFTGVSASPSASVSPSASRSPSASASASVSPSASISPSSSASSSFSASVSPSSSSSASRSPSASASASRSPSASFSASTSPSASASASRSPSASSSASTSPSPSISPSEPPFGAILKRYHNGSWIKARLMTYVGVSFQNKLLRYREGTNWVDVDVRG